MVPPSVLKSIIVSANTVLSLLLYMSLIYRFTMVSFLQD